MNQPELQKITDWLIDGARSATSPTRLMSETCERLVAAGLPLYRVGVFVRTLHPDIYGRNFIWRPGAEVEMGTVDFNILESPAFMNSPLMIVFTEGKEVRGRLEDLQGSRFSIFDDLRAEGVTDYIALPLHFTDGLSHASSWTTRQPGGFTDQQVAALRALVPALARDSRAASSTWLQTCLTSPTYSSIGNTASSPSPMNFRTSPPWSLIAAT